MYTARYFNKNVNNKEYRPVAISLGQPKFPLGYKVEAEIKILMPSYPMIKMEDRDAYQKMYFERLDRVGVDRIRKVFEALQTEERELVLLCYEDIRKPEIWCHRTMFAEWWYNKTGETIEELPEPETTRKGAKKEEEEDSTVHQFKFDFGTLGLNVSPAVV